MSDKDQGCRWPDVSSLTTSHVKADCQAPSLTRLSLAAVTRPDSPLNALSLHLSVLEQLYVRCCHLDERYNSPDVAKALRSQGLWPALEKLSLPNQMLGLASMAPLLRTDWSQLQELCLSSNYLHAGSIESLAVVIGLA